MSSKTGPNQYTMQALHNAGVGAQRREARDVFQNSISQIDTAHAGGYTMRGWCIEM